MEYYHWNQPVSLKRSHRKPVGQMFGNILKKEAWFGLSVIGKLPEIFCFSLSEESKGGRDYVILYVKQARLDQMVMDCRCKNGL